MNIKKIFKKIFKGFAVVVVDGVEAEYKDDIDAELADYLAGKGVEIPEKDISLVTARLFKILKDKIKEV